jgi:hypothetical protein
MTTVRVTAAQYRRILTIVGDYGPYADPWSAVLEYLCAIGCARAFDDLEEIHFVVDFMPRTALVVRGHHD